ncbi:Rne/Rng family ribonuclease [Cohnella lubricantis]|uniref:Rne/Rng family ribonuclease n=1 Tax=Cohnella lubricantis TaxID=2163172 RepID=A0A841TC72_9BACL|nr:Rne/Rng family ribonuclease [Cohnella lubricantis]MBB6677619.1 Rne/Rng family ribonuclease [Cohnella lubricantis]MBP2116494.1 ribonuclease G [Cohnella lubricantis]
MKQLFIHCSPKDTQSALLENGRLTEFSVERSEGSTLVGNIYKGRVVNVLPGMQAAFVDIGLSKNAFLYVDDVLHPHLDKQPKDKPQIAELLKPGDELVVQMMKEPLGGKGARVTTHYSLPGRWLVYMPNADYIGISKKIELEQERTRLRLLAEELRRPGEGVILRTNAEGEGPESLAEDLSSLRATWTGVQARGRHAAAPAELHRDIGLVQRMIRDVFTPDTEELVVDDENACREAAAYLRQTAPALESRLRLYKEQTPLYDKYGISEQLDKAFQPRIWLASGGYLVWDRTEALTVIDVNTGKYTGTVGLEETVFRTNMEAAEEIARLLRLRDVGGIVIVDFIDMESEEHRHRVVQQLEATMKMDRTKSQVLGWTRLGLLEITRKKARANVESYFYENCASCKGRGKIYTRI